MHPVKPQKPSINANLLTHAGSFVHYGEAKQLVVAKVIDSWVRGPVWQRHRDMRSTRWPSITKECRGSSEKI